VSRGVFYLPKLDNSVKVLIHLFCHKIRSKREELKDEKYFYRYGHCIANAI
jgi:hypothetical protein